MSIQVNDFQWEPGKNDAEYIKLLESSRDEWQKIAQKATAKLKALSKAQEPRVMTLEEVKASAGCDVWLELSGNIAEDVITATTIYGCGAKGICTRYETLSYDAYSIRPYGWRCWTSRPTDERREAEPW